MQSIFVLTFVLLIACFVKVGKSSVEWSSTYGWRGTILRHCCAFCSVCFYYGALCFDPGCAAWPFLLISTTVFPSFVLSMIEKINGLARTRPTSFVSAGRAVPIILFGLRYALIMDLATPLGFLDAVMVQAMVKTIKSEPITIGGISLLVSNDCFLTCIPRRKCIVYFIGRILMAPIVWNYYDGFASIEDSIAACFLLLSLNLFVNSQMELGDKIAKDVWEEAKNDLLPNNAGVRKVCNLKGGLLFGTWLLMLGGIVLSF